MLRTIACGCTSALLLTLLFSGKPQEMQFSVHAAYKAMIHSDTVNYFNLNGKQIRLPGSNRPNLNIVITYSDNPRKIKTAVIKNEVIPLPSNDVLTTILGAYSIVEQTEIDSTKEEFFMVTRKGAVSHIEEGTRDEIDTAVKNKAFRSLREASLALHHTPDDITPGYTVHTHWRKPIENDTLFGSCPSMADTASTSDFKDGAGIAIILGWEPDKSYGALPCQYIPDKFVGKGVIFVQRLCFYNTSGIIAKMDWVDFKKLVSDITVKNQIAYHR